MPIRKTVDSTIEREERIEDSCDWNMGIGNDVRSCLKLSSKAVGLLLVKFAGLTILRFMNGVPRTRILIEKRQNCSGIWAGVSHRRQSSI